MKWLRALGSRYRVASNPLRLERRFELALLLLVLLLILQLAYGLLRLGLLSAPAALEPTVDSLQVVAIPGLDAVTAEQSNEIRSRPLLWRERRPVEEVEEVVASEADDPKEFKVIKLVGVFGAGDSAGIIARVDEQGTRRVRLGEDVAGWTLESVENNEVVITAGSRQEKLVLLPELSDSADKDKKRSGRRR